MSASRENRRLVWGPVAVAVLANALGFAFNLYDRLWWYDEASHGYATFAYTLVAVALFAYGAVLTRARQHRLLFILAVGAIGLAMGTLWEVAEWT